MPQERRAGVPKQKGHACLGSLRLEPFLEGERLVSVARADASADASDDVDAGWRRDGDRAGDRYGDRVPTLRAIDLCTFGFSGGSTGW